MNHNDEGLQSLLKRSLPPVGNTDLQRDLWPDMLKRIEGIGLRSVRFDLLDWILTGIVAAFVLVFPGLIPGLLYHL